MTRKVLLTVAFLLCAALPAQADVSKKHGSFASGTGAAATTVTVNGLGFTPQVVLFWTSASPGATGTDNTSIAFGVGISSSSRRAIWAGCLDNTDPSECDNVINNALVLAIYRGTTPTLVGSFNSISLASGEFVLTVGTAFTNDVTIFYLALGGSDITNVGLVTTSNAGTGSYGDTGLGFTPDFLMLFSTNATANATITAGASFNIGFTDGTNASLFSNFCGDAAPTSACGRYVRGAASQLEVLADVNSASAVRERTSFVSFDANGFTLNRVEAAGTTLVFALGIKGARWHVGTYTTAATTTTFSTTDMTYTPVVLFVAGPTGATQSTSDTAVVSFRGMLGATDGTTTGRASSSGNNNVAANTAYANSLSTSQLYSSIQGTDGSDVDAGTFTSFDSNGWTATSTVNTNGAVFGIYWAAAANASTYTPRHRVIY